MNRAHALACWPCKQFVTECLLHRPGGSVVPQGNLELNVFHQAPELVLSVLISCHLLGHPENTVFISYCLSTIRATWDYATLSAFHKIPLGGFTHDLPLWEQLICWQPTGTGCPGKKKKKKTWLHHLCYYFPPLCLISSSRSVEDTTTIAQTSRPGFILLLSSVAETPSLCKLTMLGGWRIWLPHWTHDY